MDGNQNMDANEGSELITFIRHNYRTLHPVEAKLAYEMVLAKKINVEYLGKSLNKKNIARLLNTYIEYRSRVETFVKAKSTTNKQKTSIDPKELRKRHIEFINVVGLFYEKFKNDAHKTMSYLFSATYDLLVKNELIDGEIVPSVMEEAMTLFRARWISERTTSPIPSEDEIKEKSIGEYKELMVVRAFNQFQFEEFDLHEFLLNRVR